MRGYAIRWPRRTKTPIIEFGTGWMAAMKLFALRAADYMRSASRQDRRYLLYNPVVKMKVTTPMTLDTDFDEWKNGLKPLK